MTEQLQYNCMHCDAQADFTDPGQPHHGYPEENGVWFEWPTSRTCTWTYDHWDNAYHASCGEVFHLIEGTPATNHINYCPFCGKPLSTEQRGQEP